MIRFLRSADFLSPRFAKFCCVGIANCIVDFLLYTLLLFLGMSPYLARAMSWTLTCIFSYIVNKTWAFKARDTGFVPILRFFSINLVSLGLGLALLYIFKGLGASNSMAFIASLPFTTLMNYLGYRFWTFRLIDDKD